MLAASRGHDTLSLELRARLGGHWQCGYRTPMTWPTSWSPSETLGAQSCREDSVVGGAASIRWPQLIALVRWPFGLGLTQSCLDQGFPG